MAMENLLIKNRKASFEYSFIETLEAGIVLTGTEIKSVRAGKVSLSDGYCLFKDNELFLSNVHIEEYKEGSYNNHEPKRMRKLLLSRRELNKLLAKTKAKGLTIIPVKMYITDRSFAKIEIALARGKKMYDKRQDLKKKDASKQMRQQAD
jgi:SsrA-binding protein